MQVSLSSELHMLTHQLDRLAQKSRRSRDFTFNTLRYALREVIACFPVYRSYIDAAGASPTDRHDVEVAVRRARLRNPLASSRVFRFIRDMLLGGFAAEVGDDERAERLRFAGKFQQVTAPVMAKGVEDTVFYVYNRLISLSRSGWRPPPALASAPEGAARVQSGTAGEVAFLACHRYPHMTPAAARTSAPASMCFLKSPTIERRP